MEAHAALTGTITINTPTNGKLAALTAKQVITLTISGATAPTLSEESVTGVTLSDADVNCQNISSYVVTSATTLTVKTPGTGCAVSTTAEDLVLHINGDTLTKADSITFVPPPRIKATATATVKPVVTEYSADLSPYAQKRTRFFTTGGQTVRVLAETTFAFDPRTAAGLKVNLGGKDGTEVKVFATGNTSTPTAIAAGTQLTTANTTDAMVGAAGTSGTELGNYLTFKTASGMDPNNDNLTITQNGVSKTFTPGDSAGNSGPVDVVAGPVITAITPTFGKPNGGTTVTVTASGLDRTLTAGTDTEVYFCNKEAAATAFSTASGTPTGLTVTVPDVTNDANGLGTGVYAGSCPVTIRLPNATPSPYTSPLNSVSLFNFPNEQ